ncbi:hypothetical protein T261_01599 [Streptomyces lydicus]|nr:hypothetical protein T261_01599 [Streptomyces lydicus]
MAGPAATGQATSPDMSASTPGCSPPVHRAVGSQHMELAQAVGLLRW